jgi:hypothetical protein
MRIFDSVGYLLPFIFWILYRAQTNFLNGSVLVTSTSLRGPDQDHLAELRRPLRDVLGAKQDPPFGGFIWSGRQDSNLRPLRPERSALPSCATPRLMGGKNAHNPPGGKPKYRGALQQSSSGRIGGNSQGLLQGPWIDSIGGKRKDMDRIRSASPKKPTRGGHLVEAVHRAPIAPRDLAVAPSGEP